jgi:HSP20 family protein
MMVPSGARWLRNEMDRLFDRAWDGDDQPNFGEWVPRMDLSDSPEILTAKVEVPGIDPKDIQITLEHDMLTVRGEKRVETERKDEKSLRTERVYGSFERKVQLPVAVDAKRVTAAFKNGLLLIEMPKAPEAKGTTVPIKVY